MDRGIFLKDLMSITFSLISQDKVVAESEVDEVLLPTTSGEIGVLPHHIDLITVLKTGEITARKSGKDDHFAVFGGVAHINGKVVVVLADRAEHVAEIDLAKAEQAKRDAEKLKETAQNEVEMAHAIGLIERNINRIELVKRRRSHSHRTPNPHETTQ